MLYFFVLTNKSTDFIQKLNLIAYIIKNVY